jgi:hypothetical protein
MGTGVEVAVGRPAILVAAIAVARLGLKGLKKMSGRKKMVKKQINVKMISPIIIASKMVSKLPKPDINLLLNGK